MPLPKHFRIESEGGVEDCHLDAEKVNCTRKLDPLPDNYESWTGEVTGTLSGLTLTGTSVTHEVFHLRDDPGCRTVQRRSGPVTYEFRLDGMVFMSEGLMLVETENSGNCPGKGAFSDKQWGGQGSGRWSEIG